MLQTKIANTRSAILAFYPRPTGIGFAVMDNPTSVRASGFRYINAQELTSYIEGIRALITYYQPTHIILESETSRRQHRGTKMLRVFEELEREITFPILHYSRRDIRRHFGEKDKHEIACMIAEQFPEYIDQIPKRRSSIDGAESPRISEFDALSLGITHFALNESKRHQ